MILNDEDVDTLRKNLPAVCRHQDVIRAAESAVINKLKEGVEPVAYFQVEFYGGNPMYQQVGSQHKDEEGVFPLHEHPDPQVAELRAEIETYTAQIDKWISRWDKSTRQRDELLTDIERVYRMLLSEPDTKGALFKAENILREAIASVKGGSK